MGGRSHTKRFLISLSVAMVAASILLTNVYAINYGMRELPLPEGYISSIASAVNNAGVIIGGVWDTSGNLYSAKWNLDGTVDVDLANMPSRIISEAININGHGQIISCVTDREYRCHGILSNPDGTWIDIGSLGGNSTVPWGINDLGQIVGRSRTAAREDRAFLWSEETGMIDISERSSSYAYAINNSGVISGDGIKSAAPDDPIQWTVIKKDGRYFIDQARCINEQGQAGGEYYGNAVIWNLDGTKTQLGLGSVWGLNNLGQAVGTSDGHAVMWNPNGEVVTLDPIPNCSDMYGIDINESGTIVGHGLQSGWYHAAVWEVVPEPSSLLGLLAGLNAFIGVFVRARK